MRCEQSRSLLFDYVDGGLEDSVLSEITEHLDHCANCQTDYQGILDIRAQARTWHDLPVPPWQPPLIQESAQATGLVSALQSWFPTVASTVALTLVIGLNLQGSDPATVPTDSRLERQQELQTLVRLVVSEMDRRSQETEENLRYIITHQIQGQRDIDDLYQRVQEISYRPTGEQM